MREPSRAAEASRAVEPFRPAAPPPEHPVHEHPVHDHDDHVADAFFRDPDKPVIDVWEEELKGPTMSRGSRRAMLASIGIFAVSAISITAYSVYHNVIMPAPAELGAIAGDVPAVLPTPIHARQPSAAEPETQLLAATDPTVPAQAVGALPATSMRASLLGGPRLMDAPKEEPTSATPARAPEAAPAPARADDAKPEPELPEPPAEAFAVEPSDESPSSAGGATYDELVELGQSLNRRNRGAEAGEAFRRALWKDPDGTSALSGLALVYLNTEENQLARTYAQRAVKADATNAEGWIVLGAALEILGDKAASQDAYRNCVATGSGPYLVQCKQVVRN